MDDSPPPPRRKAPNGAGSLETLPSGRTRVRLTIPGRGRKSTKPYATRDEAERIRRATLVVLARGGGAPTGATTLAQFAPTWLDAREEAGDHRNLASERSLWRRHVALAPFAERPLANITEADVRAWLKQLAKTKASIARGKAKPGKTDRCVSRQTRVHALNLLRALLEGAREAEAIKANVARDLRVKKDARSDEGWTHLTADEIALAVGEKVPEPARLLYTVAIYTGMRKGELWGLRWDDVQLAGERPEVTVRYSHRGPTKSGRVRRVPLLAPARAALERWKQLCPATPEGLVFPTAGGCRRQKTDDADWADRKVCQGKRKGEIDAGHKTRAGITRRVRFHDLRHTCASHLVMGTWGTTWSLTEVCAFLGHSNISVTQRYAHLSPDHLHRKAAATAVAPTPELPPAAVPAAVPEPVAVAQRGQPAPPPVVHAVADSFARPPRFELGTFGLEGHDHPERLRVVAAENGQLVGNADDPSAEVAFLEAVRARRVDHDALAAMVADELAQEGVRLALAIEAGDPRAVAMGVRLAVVRLQRKAFEAATALPSPATARSKP